MRTHLASWLLLSALGAAPGIAGCSAEAAPAPDAAVVDARDATTSRRDAESDAAPRADASLHADGSGRPDASAVKDAADGTVADASVREASFDASGPGSACFSADTIHHVTPTAPPFLVLRVPSAPPPNDDAATSLAYPGNAVAGYPWGAAMTTTTETTIGTWEYIWSDRGLSDGGPVTAFGASKANQDPAAVVVDGGACPKACGPVFTTYLKAIGSTAIRMMWSLGYAPRNDPSAAGIASLLTQEPLSLALTTPTPGWLDVADAFGFDTSGWAPYLASAADLDTDEDLDGGTGPIAHLSYVQKHASALCHEYSPKPGVTYEAMTNEVILGEARAVDLPSTSPVRGEVVDFEMDDDRGAPLTLATVKLLFQITKTKNVGLVLSSDPLTGAGSHLDVTSSIGAELLQNVTGYAIVADETPSCNADAGAAGKCLYCPVDAGQESYLDCVTSTLFTGPDGGVHVPVDRSRILVQVALGDTADPAPPASACHGAPKDSGVLSEQGAEGVRAYVLAGKASGVVLEGVYGTKGPCTTVGNQRVRTILGLP